jgi:hypothetical protein
VLSPSLRIIQRFGRRDLTTRSRYDTQAGDTRKAVADLMGADLTRLVELLAVGVDELRGRNCLRLHNS